MALFLKTKKAVFMTVLQSVGNDFRHRSKLKKDLLII